MAADTIISKPVHHKKLMVNKKYVCPVPSCLLPRKRRFQQFKITKTGKIHGFQLSPVCLRLSKLLVILILNLQSTTRTGAMQIGCLRVSLVTLLVQTLDNGNESFLLKELLCLLICLRRCFPFILKWDGKLKMAVCFLVSLLCCFHFLTSLFLLLLPVSSNHNMAGNGMIASIPHNVEFH